MSCFRHGAISGWVIEFFVSEWDHVENALIGHSGKLRVVFDIHRIKIIMHDTLDTDRRAVARCYHKVVPLGLLELKK